jgi:hypothetical protein
MTTWRELERDFDDLHQGGFSHLGARVDRTWGEGIVDEWRVSGGAGSLLESRFRSLATLAGRMIETLDDSLVDPSLLVQHDHFQRWLLAIWQSAPPVSASGTSTSEDGRKSTFLFGSLQHPAAVSANLCLQHAAHSVPLVGRVDVQLQSPRYAAVLGHWRKAQAFLTPHALDLPNAVKEAVSSVEALGQIVTASSGATLGDCVKLLRRAGLVSPPLLKGMEELWGFASESPGVRHGSPKDPTLARAEADYVLDQAQAALKLLLSLDRAS